MICYEQPDYSSFTEYISLWYCDRFTVCLWHQLEYWWLCCFEQSMQWYYLFDLSCMHLTFTQHLFFHVMFKSVHCSTNSNVFFVSFLLKPLKKGDFQKEFWGVQRKAKVKGRILKFRRVHDVIKNLSHSLAKEIKSNNGNNICQTKPL